MKIKNKSNWATEDLRKFFSAICDYIGVEKQHREIVVNPFQRGWVGGLGSLYRNWLMVVVKNDCSEKIISDNGEITYKTIENPIEMTKYSKENIAKTFIHELRHNQGLRHKDLIYHEEIPQDILEIPIRKKPEEPEQKIDLRKARYEKLLLKIKRYESISKRTQNKLKKLYKQRKYYDKMVGNP